MKQGSSRFLDGLGKAVGQLRLKHGRSRAGLADSLSVAENTVRRLEAGETGVAISRLPDLAEQLGTTTPELVKLACKLGGVK